MMVVGEEVGVFDVMLVRIVDFNECEVDEVVIVFISLMEFVIMVVLGVVIGGLVVVMYLLVFCMGVVV